MSEMKFLVRESLTWSRAWKQVADKYGDVFCMDHYTGEHWQYMGSVVRDRDTPAHERVEHQFRHRCLPESIRAKVGASEREYFKCYTYFQPEDYQ